KIAPRPSRRPESIRDRQAVGATKIAAPPRLDRRAIIASIQPAVKFGLHRDMKQRHTPRDQPRRARVHPPEHPGLPPTCSGTAPERKEQKSTTRRQRPTSLVTTDQGPV